MKEIVKKHLPLVLFIVFGISELIVLKEIVYSPTFGILYYLYKN